MTFLKGARLYLVILLLVPFQTLHADECDDAFKEAADISASAKEALDEKEYKRAAELYEESGERYEKVSGMRGCRCPKIAGAARSNMDSRREWAAKCLNWAEEQQVLEEFDRAKDRYNEGRDWARNRDWDNAIYAFEDAAGMWEGIAATDTENGRKAAENAELARGAAEQARRDQGAAEGEQDYQEDDGYLEQSEYQEDYADSQPFPSSCQDRKPAGYDRHAQAAYRLCRQFQSPA